VAAAVHGAWRSGWQRRSQSCLPPLCRLNLKVPSSEPSRSPAFSAPTSLLSSTSSMSLIRSTSLPVPCPSATPLGRWRRGLDLQVHQHVPIRGEENRCPQQANESHSDDCATDWLWSGALSIHDTIGTAERRPRSSSPPACPCPRRRKLALPLQL
jgi:hypothetical protein